MHLKVIVVLWYLILRWQKYSKVYLAAALPAGKLYQKLGYSYQYDVPKIVLDGNLDVVYMEKQLD